MNRLYAVLFVATVAGCGPKNPESLCNQTPAPTACQTVCDPQPGAPNTCPAGYHCSPGGTCDLQCTQGGGQCPDGDSCSNDGYCNVDGTNPVDVDANCPAVHFTPMPVIPSIELVLDRSGSMDMPFSGNMSRYQTLEDALFNTTTGAIVTSQAQVYFGEELFAGDSGQNPCTDGPPGSLNINGYSAPRALNNASVLSMLTANKPPNGGATPTSAALDTAVAGFAANPPPPGSPPIILLATDGEPNSCGNGADNGRSVNSTTTAYNLGIQTYIIGLAGVNNAFLQQIANAGVHGTNAPYYTANNAAALVTAFNTIIAGAISCDLTINQMVDPGSAPNATVTLDGSPLTFGTDWTLDANGMTIHILGAACATLKSTPSAVVDATFPCGSVIF